MGQARRASKGQSQDERWCEMSIYKRGEVYWYKFMWQGKVVRESTKQGNDKVARQMEAAHRTSPAKGEVGIREKKPAPTVKEFLKQEFLPYTETAHVTKPLTLRYYKQGVDTLLRSKIAALAIDQLSDQNAQHFAAEYVRLSPSGINRGLRTLRRALNLAYQWGRMEKPVRIFLAKGEKQRDRVLTDKELSVIWPPARNRGRIVPRSSPKKRYDPARFSSFSGRMC